MLLCPDCRVELNASETCSSCAWSMHRHNNVKIMLSKADIASGVFSSYHKNYEDIAEEDLKNSILQERYISILADKICKLSPSMTGKDVCDVGSGKGFLLRRILKEKPKSISAVDISLNYLERFDPSIDSYQANAENLPFKERFDILTCTDVLEHVINPANFLWSMNQAVKPNGYVIIRVPYKENLLNYAVQGGCKYQFAHLRDFNKENLTRLIKFAGFKPIALKLEGFSIQTPGHFWQKTPKRQMRYNRWQAKIREWITNDDDVNLWPSCIARLLFNPYEIVIVAKKVARL